MSLATPPVAPFTPPRRFATAADWFRALGDVPPERVLFDPWPGTATEADLLRLVERDKQLVELVDGTLVEKPVGFWESRVAANLIAELNAYANDHDLGIVTGADSTLRLAWSGRVRLPDVAYIAKARVPTTYESIPTLAPDLAVEVLSPTNTPAEMAQKLKEYFNSGTRLAWYVDPPTRTVAVYHGVGEPTVVLTDADVLDGGEVVPGFTMPVADLFRGLPAAGK